LKVAIEHVTEPSKVGSATDATLVLEVHVELLKKEILEGLLVTSSDVLRGEALVLLEHARDND
jgi:hypothetical protein